MSDNPNDPTQWQDEPEMGAPLMDDPALDEPTADELDDPELNAAEAEADDVDPELDPDLDVEPIDAEPGADGPEGTGIEGADDALLEDSGEGDELDAPDISGEFSTDSATAADLGNRPGDEMLTEDED